MKQYEFKDRSGIAIACLLLAFFTYGGVVLSSAGIGAVVFLAVCGVFLLGVILYTGVQTKIISEAGITVKTILKTTFVPWADVERISVAHLPVGPAGKWYLSVTYQTESGKSRGLLFPCTDPLRAGVEEFYGELDFDRTKATSPVCGKEKLFAQIVNPWIKERRVFGVMGAVIAIYGVAVGAYIGSWVPVIGMLLLSLIFVTVFDMDYPYAAMSEAGVTYRFLLRRRFLPWQEIRQAGVCLFEKKKAIGNVYKSYKLGLLLPNGVPKKPGQRFSYYKNLGRVLYLPDTRENRDFVIAHYGLLDFDESADLRGYSIVVD